jgi:transposase
MPWKESNLMDERLRFVAKLLDGESMSSVCREFGISRKTGYKIFNRYKLSGLEGLQNQSRRPSRQANKLPFQVERAILRIEQERPKGSSAACTEGITSGDRTKTAKIRLQLVRKTMNSMNTL